MELDKGGYSSLQQPSRPRETNGPEDPYYKGLSKAALQRAVRGASGAGTEEY